MMDDSRPLPPLYTYDFVVLCLVTLFGFANIAMFYSFHVYMQRLGLPPDWRGPLLALEPMAALVLRPFLGPRLTPWNATRAALAGLAAMALALLCYPLARSVWPLALVRLLHGAGFVVLVSSVAVLLAHVLPRERSGQGFGVYTVATLLPFALIPPLVEALLRILGDEALVYAWAAILCLPSALFLLPLGRRLARQAPAAPLAATGSKTLAGLRLPGVPRLLIAALFLFLATTPVTFFIKRLALDAGLDDPGLFFSVSMAATIATRLFSGRLFDRLPKGPVTALALAGLALCLACLGLARDGASLLTLAALYGLCLGVAMPLLNASIFLATPPDLRGVVLNLFLFTMDAGTVLGPLLGGLLLARGVSLEGVYQVCGLAAAMGLCWVLAARTRDSAG
ncbi:MFS transporter [Desulfovibrio sp.]